MSKTTRRRGLAGLVAASLLATGCAGDGQDTGKRTPAPPSSMPSDAPTNLLEGRHRIRAFVEDTRTATLGGLEVKERYSPPDSGLCGKDPEGPHYHDVGIRMVLPTDRDPAAVMEKVASYWRSQGQPVRGGQESEDLWEVNTRFYNDFRAWAIVSTIDVPELGEGQVSLNARTSCLPRPGIRDADNEDHWPTLPPVP